MCVFILFSPSSLIIHINVSLYDTIYCTTSFYSVQLTMDDETCLDWLNNMNFKNIVWFIKAISYFVLLRLGIIIIIIIIIIYNSCCFVSGAGLTCRAAVSVKFHLCCEPAVYCLVLWWVTCTWSSTVQERNTGADH